jgi:hypothetical protein
VRECTPEFYRIQTETCQEGAPVEVIDSGRSLKVVEHLGGEDYAEEGTERIESLRVLWKLCQEGIE